MDENRSSIVVNFIVRAVVGLGVIFFTNEILASKGISVAVGLNGLSLLTSGTLDCRGSAYFTGFFSTKTCEYFTKSVKSKNAYRQKEKMSI